jgi:hypothetical protein
MKSHRKSKNEKAENNKSESIYRRFFSFVLIDAIDGIKKYTKALQPAKSFFEQL